MDIYLRNQLVSPLLRLSGEIRNLIYHYVFSGSRVRLDQPEGKAQLARKLKVLVVCRQIRDETRNLPFTLSTFSVDPRVGKDWIADIPAEKCLLVTKLHSRVLLWTPKMLDPMLVHMLGGCSRVSSVPAHPNMYEVLGNSSIDMRRFQNLTTIECVFVRCRRWHPAIVVWKLLEGLAKCGVASPREGFEWITNLDQWEARSLHTGSGACSCGRQAETQNGGYHPRS
ncbi:hypothetical protein M011DRAFT_188416 [Sporormia fimetaria CBS 119925]|uniref:F-box domain-containing protein n=1 Tax=Sporormia fimetaria CBS 119925 TaxID=1340428 RepID=A0A6A6VK27_9PLEO|nr:hypothetical protein M011DRAFT_188416 [Sporormia fimetaria CBS 119925]